MPGLMKDGYYNYNTIHELAMCVNAVYPTFPADDFIADVMDETWDMLELKASMRRITINLGKYLPPDYECALGILDKAIADTSSRKHYPGIHSATLIVNGVEWSTLNFEVSGDKK